MDNTTVSLYEAIRDALLWERERTCTPEVMARVWNGFCDKLEARGTMTPAEIHLFRDEKWTDR